MSVKAVRLQELADPSALKCIEVPVPVDDTKVLIEIRGVGINYPDQLMTYGKYQIRVPTGVRTGATIAASLTSQNRLRSPAR